MALYNITAGLKNRNASIIIPKQEFDTVEEAMEAARDFATKIYQFCTGYYWEDCWEELNGDYDHSNPLYTDEEVDDYYYEEVDNKMNYFVTRI